MMACMHFKQAQILALLYQMGVLSSSITCRMSLLLAFDVGGRRGGFNVCLLAERGEVGGIRRVQGTCMIHESFNINLYSN